MRAVRLIFASFAGVLFHHAKFAEGDTKRIDEARVTFSIIDRDVVQKWERFFENASNKQTGREACNNLAFKVVSDEEISRCVRFTMFTRTNLKGTGLKVNDLAKLRKSGFNTQNPTIIILHGFFHNHEKTGDSWMERMRNAVPTAALASGPPLPDHVIIPLLNNSQFNWLRSTGKGTDDRTEWGKRADELLKERAMRTSSRASRQPPGFAFLSLVDVNVMLVKWSPLSDHVYYPLVVQNAASVAGYLSQLIRLMVDEGANLKEVHIIGHSLGAHIGGMASQSLTAGIIGRITGLDPAGPLFLKGHDSTRLDRSDADFVDCIHTNHGFLGISSPVCHADFFVNGGRVQPGCCEWVNVGKCGHLRSTAYFAESISESVKFEAYSCATMPDLDPVTCFHSGALMGFPANNSFQGIFYVETGMEKPFHQIPPKKKLAELEVQCFSTFPLTWIIDSI